MTHKVDADWIYYVTSCCQKLYKMYDLNKAELIASESDLCGTVSFLWTADTILNSEVSALTLLTINRISMNLPGQQPEGWLVPPSTANTTETSSKPLAPQLRSVWYRKYDKTILEDLVNVNIKKVIQYKAIYETEKLHAENNPILENGNKRLE